MSLANDPAARVHDANRQLAMAYEGASVLLSRSAMAAADISRHHQQCGVCRRGGQLVIGRRGITRAACPAELELFRELERRATLDQAAADRWAL